MLEPFHRIAVTSNKYEKGWPEGDRSFEILPLEEALKRRYEADQHLVMYVAGAAESGRQHRVRKEEEARTPYPWGPLTISVLFADVDTGEGPRHLPWDDEAKGVMRDLLTRAITTAGWYFTSRGVRVVQPLVRPILATESEPYLKSWLFDLERSGLRVDWRCKDWTRMFRLPNILRDGRPFHSEMRL